MAPRKRLALLVVVVAAALLVSGSLAAAEDGAELGGTVAARGVVNNGYLGDSYIGCLEMGFSRCFAHPTLICLEDAMVECSLQAAAAAPAAATATGPAAPLAGGRAEAELVFGGAIGGIITRGITDLGFKYIQCVEVDLAVKCLSDPTIGCVEEAMGAC